MRYTNMGLTLVLIILIVNTVSTAALGVPADPNRQEFLRDYSQAEALRSQVDVNAVKACAEQLQRRWAKRNKEYHAKLMLRICVSLRSTKLAGAETTRVAARLAREYALAALADANQIPLETELGLVGQVTSNMMPKGAPASEQWTQQRMIDVRVRLHALNRLADAIDKDWDPNDFWSLKIPRPPANIPWISGNPPEAIEDPQIRASYEAALKEYWEKVEYHNRQRQLRKLQRLFLPKAKHYIARAYAIPPSDVDELKRLLRQYRIDHQVASSILKPVENRQVKAGYRR